MFLLYYSSSSSTRTFITLYYCFKLLLLLLLFQFSYFRNTRTHFHTQTDQLQAHLLLNRETKQNRQQREEKKQNKTKRNLTQLNQTRKKVITYIHAKCRLACFLWLIMLDNLNESSWNELLYKLCNFMSVCVLYEDASFNKQDYSRLLFVCLLVRSNCDLSKHQIDLRYFKQQQQEQRETVSEQAKASKDL